jgi:hypothetical protein
VDGVDIPAGVSKPPYLCSRKSRAFVDSVEEALLARTLSGTGVYLF